MPFLIPGARMSMAFGVPPVNLPAPPPQSECESVTPRSQAYPDTPPVLEADIFDSVPFSASFSGFLSFSTQDGALQSPAVTADAVPDFLTDSKRLSSRAEASYYVEQLTNIRDVDSEWEDDEVEEVMIISPKPKTSPPVAIGSSIAHALPTPPFSPLEVPPQHLVPKESYTILRTLHRTQTSHLSLAVASGCTSSTKKATLRHALYAIRTYRMPLSSAAIAERAALEVLSESMRSRGGNPYVQRASRFWDNGETLFMVLEHCGGGNLMRLIQVEGPIDSARMKQWACEIASGVAFIHSAGIIHSNLRPSTVLFRVNGHVCLSGFEHSIVIATRQNVPPSINERQHGVLASEREWCEAPEMLFGWEIGLEVDCWAFGVILVWMITGKQPWFHGTREHPNMIRDCILNGLLPVAPLEGVDSNVEDLIRKCLERNPSKRPTIEEIKTFEWFVDINWDNISLARVPDIQITLPTPDLTPDVPGDMPSTIIAPDLSLSTVDTEMEIEGSFLWTSAHISLPVGLASPGALTIASGQSAVLSQVDRLFPGRPRNPSPPSLPSSTGGGDMPTPQLQRQQKEEQGLQSFLPELGDTDGTLQVGLDMCIDEFGTFLSDLGHESTEISNSGGSPEISLQDALALPIPLLVTPRTSEAELRAVRRQGMMPSGLPARLLCWRSGAGPGVAQDVVLVPHANQEHVLPELLWHGLDADPFRCSPPPSVPTEVQEIVASDGGGGCEDVASPRRVDATFRWSNASLELEMGISQNVPGHGQSNAHATSFAALSALTRRIREQGRALLRKSRSIALLPRPRSRFFSGPSPHPPSMTFPLRGGGATALEGGVVVGSVRRIGLGIGYSLPGTGPTSSTPRQERVMIGMAVPASAPASAQWYAAHEDGEETVLAGCYSGLGGGGGRRGKKNASAAQRVQQPEHREQSQQVEPGDGIKSAAADGGQRRMCDEPGRGSSPCGSDSGSVLILGNPGFGGAATTDVDVE